VALQKLKAHAHMIDVAEIRCVQFAGKKIFE
jgi:hypothetical protein